MNKIFLTLFAMVLIVALAIPAAVAGGPASNPVGLWDFNYNANDTAGFNNLGTLHGNATYATVETRQVLSLDGNGDYVSVADQAELDLSNEITVEAWVKLNQLVTNVWYAIVIKGEDGFENYELLVNGNGQAHSALLFDDGLRRGLWMFTPEIEADKWYYIAMTYKPGEWALYVNGQVKDHATFSSTFYPEVNNTQLLIGTEIVTGAYTRFFNGKIDKVRIWNVALTASEIAANYFPVAYPNFIGTGANIPVSIPLSGSDTEDCNLNFSIVTSPSHGTLGSITNNSCAGTGPYTDSATVTYTPSPGYTGLDSFTYKVDDGTLHSTPVTVEITVNPAPVLTASITTPTNGTTYQVGQCFDVTAKITVACPMVTADANSFWESLFARPVYAVPMPTKPGASNVKATISIAGSATTAEPATKAVIDTLPCIPDTGQTQATVTWNVCCTGPGQVNITITPSGDYSCGAVIGQDLLDFLVKPVFAGALPALCPIPSSNLVRSTVTIQQISGQRTEPAESYAKSFPYSRGRVGITYLTVTPQVAQAGQAVTISGNISNPNEEASSYTVTVKVNDEVLEVKKGTLGAHAATPLKYEIVKNEPGVYVVDINGQQASFSVNGEAKGADSSDSALPVIIAVIIMVGAAAGIAILLIRRRQQSGYY